MEGLASIIELTKMICDWISNDIRNSKGILIPQNTKQAPEIVITFVNVFQDEQRTLFTYSDG